MGVLFLASLAAVLALGSAVTLRWNKNNNWENTANWEGSIVPGANDRVIFPDAPCTSTFTPRGAVVRVASDISVSSIVLPINGRILLDGDMRITLTGLGTSSVQWACRPASSSDFMCGNNWDTVDARNQPVRVANSPPCFNDVAFFPPNMAFQVSVPTNDVHVDSVVFRGSSVANQDDWTTVAAGNPQEVTGPAISINSGVCSDMDCRRLCVNTCPEMNTNTTEREANLLAEANAQSLYTQDRLSTVDSYVAALASDTVPITVNLPFTVDSTAGAEAATNALATIRNLSGLLVPNPSQMNSSCVRTSDTLVTCTVSTNVPVSQQSFNWQAIITSTFTPLVSARLAGDQAAYEQARANAVLNGGPSNTFSRTIFDYTDLSFSTLDFPTASRVPIFTPTIFAELRAKLTVGYCQNIFGGFTDARLGAAKKQRALDILKEYLADMLPITTAGISIEPFSWTYRSASNTSSRSTEQAVMSLRVSIFHSQSITLDAASVRLNVVAGLYNAMEDSVLSVAQSAVSQYTVTPAPGSDDSSASTGGLPIGIPVIAGAGGGLVVLILVIALLVVRSRRRRAAGQKTVKSDRSVVAFENPMYEDSSKPVTGRGGIDYVGKDGGGLYDEPAFASGAAAAAPRGVQSNPAYAAAEQEAGSGYLDVAPNADE